ncbi:unnamed protein product, partial [Vitrella brassicaformis CCMP3155]
QADSLPPSWDGGGLIDASQPVYDTQFLPPHTGMCYTPPKFSDHIAVTLCLDNTPHTPAGHHIDFGQRVAVDMKDTKTTRSQPHRGWKGIQSFFQPAPKPTPAANNQSSSAAPAPAPAAANNGNKNNGSSSGAIDLTAGDDANGTGAPVRQPTQQQQQQQQSGRGSASRGGRGGMGGRGGSGGGGGKRPAGQTDLRSFFQKKPKT